MQGDVFKIYRAIGQRIYNLNNARERRRYYVFLVRCLTNCSGINIIWAYFHSTPLLKEIQQLNPFVYEQPTRAFFYTKSTFDERSEIVRNHIGFLVDKLKQTPLLDIYKGNDFSLWNGIEINGKKLCASLHYNSGQRKEGMLSVMLWLDAAALYQIIFWIAPDKGGEWSMWIGAMQGPNMEDAKDVIKKVTKHCHSYRTKNLILYIAQALARGLDLRHIYAVTNDGYYANNHVRMDRKLKTSFSDFWLEAGGNHTEDVRFDELPLVEKRKSMEEVPVRKRAVYRKRFCLLDEIDASILESISVIRV